MTYTFVRACGKAEERRILLKLRLGNVKWVACHHGVERPQVAAGGDGLQIWRVDENISNKQSRTADKGWPSSLGIGRVLRNPIVKYQHVM
jgi:hypothetical protein